MGTTDKGGAVAVRSNIATAPAGERMALVPRTLDELARLAKYCCAMTGQSPNEENVARTAGIMQTGLECGLPPMRSIALIDAIPARGGGFKIRLSSAARRALVLASPVCEYFRVGETRDSKSGMYVAAWAEAKRVDDPEPRRITVHVDEFKAKIKNAKPGSTWADAYTRRRMLVARASGILADDMFPDVLAGVVDESAEVVVQAGAIEVGTPLDEAAVTVADESDGPLAEVTETDAGSPADDGPEPDALAGYETEDPEPDALAGTDDDDLPPWAD